MRVIEAAKPVRCPYNYSMGLRCSCGALRSNKSRELCGDCRREVGVFGHHPSLAAQVAKAAAIAKRRATIAASAVVHVYDEPAAPEAIAERNAAMAADLSPAQRLLGDPLPGRSALERAPGTIAGMQAWSILAAERRSEDEIDRRQRKDRQRKRDQRAEYARRKAKRGLPPPETNPRRVIPQEKAPDYVLAERERAMACEQSPTAWVMGDPLPGRSALDRRVGR